MPRPTLLLRDAVIAAALLSALGFVGGVESGVAMTAGAAAAVLNFALLILAVGDGSPWAWLRLAAKLPLAALLLLFLVKHLAVAPLLVGFAAPLLALTARGVVGVFRPLESA